VGLISPTDDKPWLALRSRIQQADRAFNDSLAARVCPKHRIAIVPIRTRPMRLSVLL
jgi:hypothetical protein